MSAEIARSDPWQALKAHTPARVAIGRSGVSIPTAEQLRFGLAHAQARDAVQLALDADALQAAFAGAGFATLRVESAAPDRASYLLRPDLGRRPSEHSQALLHDAVGGGCDLLPVVGDGLSSLAVSRHALPLMQSIRDQAPSGWTLGPVVIATQARVAIGDPIGAALAARFVAVLIGERPGLSSPDSLGIYLTREPRPGRSDAERNCISNVRPAGLAADAAAHTLWWLCVEGDRIGATGVGLKDHSAPLRLGDSAS